MLKGEAHSGNPILPQMSLARSLPAQRGFFLNPFFTQVFARCLDKSRRTLQRVVSHDVEAGMILWSITYSIMAHMCVSPSKCSIEHDKLHVLG